MIKEILYRVGLAFSITFDKLHRLFRHLFRKAKIHNQYWDDSAQLYSPKGFKRYWETLEDVSRYQNQCMSGDPEKDFVKFTLEYLENTVGTDSLKGLSIGCSEQSAPEMAFCGTGWFKEFEVFDIAENLLKRQEHAARSKGFFTIQYTPKDINRLDLVPNSYDMIWAVGTVHHLERLEHFFDQVNRGLSDKGIFVMREYVGPKFLQFTGSQLNQANKALAELSLPYKLQWNCLPKMKIKPVKLQKLLKADPSEAVRSDEILTILEQKLDVVYAAKTGGALLHILLDGIAFNFERFENGREILRALIEREKELTANGELEDDFVFYIARKK
jgi:SAM-dependent methyltransferase